MKALRLTIAMAFVMITAYGFFYVGLIGNVKPPVQREVSENWTVDLKGEVLNNVNLSEYKAANILKGDILTLTNTLPDCKIPCASILINNYLAEMDIYVDNVLIYVTGKKDYENGKIVGYGMHIVNLPTDYEGKEIKIVYKAGENNGIGTLIPMIIMEQGEAGLYLIRKNVFPAAMALTDMIVGISMIGISVVYVTGNKAFRQMLYIGLFSFFIGLWAFCDHDIVLLINNNYKMKTVSEYGSLYLAPVFIFAYFWAKIKDKVSNTGRLIYRSIFGWDIFLIILTFLLHAFNFVHLTQLLTLHHATILVMITYMFANFVNSVIKKEKKDMAFYIGILALSLCGVADIIYFTVLTYSKNVKGNFDGISYTGAGILVISMVMDFAEEMSKTVRQAGEVAVYEQMANSDFLTGLANRRQCELVFDEIDAEDSDYAVIAFDLNNLKEVNDKHGHAAGDKLLKDFANILKSVFDSVATVGRTGGDEFVVIIRHADVLNLDQLLEVLDTKILETNKKKREYKLSAARGVCTRLDNKKNVRSAYRTADQRMYENKIRMKADAKGKLS
ncbi:MAG: diguanylate cyclase [Lachnospiraceae bacterium]|nr:diguanylate cyclase [Lachnospiraceae bacterium]